MIFRLGMDVILGHILETIAHHATYIHVATDILDINVNVMAKLDFWGHKIELKTQTF
jgi:hypothetical protein